ncbi:PAQR family membrane homeostasis protein TrhA [Helcococcus ovis]|uniref:PAQR family membrane homeostasis protein TrhA n=1 Tax=Helcococcus ovis TaxID=72026 RepID=UPI0038BCF959
MKNSEDELLEQYNKTKENLEKNKLKIKQIKEQTKFTKEEYLNIIKKIEESDVSNNSELCKIKLYHYNKKINILTEIFNAITHGIGVFLGIVGLLLLLIKANTSIQYIAYSIYGASIILLFLASTLYHSLSFTKAKKVFRIIDHSSIFLLIAGTYTPYLLISLYNKNGLLYFIIIWAIAIIGISIKAVMFDKSKKLGLILYIAMGWISLLMINDLLKSIDLMGIILLALGGLTYTFGVYFYKKKDMLFSHVIWHLFVLGGAILMFMSIYFFI